MSLIQSTEQYHQVLREIATLNGDDPIAIDTEGTSVRPYVDYELRGVSLAYRGREQGLYIPVSHPNSWNVDRPELLAEVLNDRCWASPFIFHNASYDMAVLERGIGLRPRENAKAYWDTALVAWLLDENSRHGLKPIAARLWGEDEAEEQQALKRLMKGETQAEAYKRLRTELAETGIKEPAAATKERAKAISAASKRTWADLTAEEIAPYAAKDAALTLRLYRHQLADPGFETIRPALEREFAVQMCVYRMMRNGVAVDTAKVLEAKESHLRRMAEIEAQLAPVNLGSPKQLAELVYEQWGFQPLEFTGTGAPSTSRAALELHAGSHAGLDLILEYRKLQKAVSGFYDQLLDNLDENDRVHPSFNMIGTVTGRAACSGPNLQQRPRDAADVFTAAPGYVLISGDMSQAELRIAASLAQEPAMIDEFDAGRDIYMRTANGLGIDRQTAKVVALGSQYGIGGRKLARSLLKGTGKQVQECKFWTTAPEDRKGLRKCGACDSCSAKDLLDNFWGSVPFLRELNQRLIAFAEANRYVPLHTPGRRRRYPTPDECRAMKLIDWPRPYTSLNAVVQGSCAELLKDWILASERPLAGIGARQVCMIHDSVSVEAPLGSEEQVARILQEALDRVTPKSWVRIPVEVKEGM